MSAMTEVTLPPVNTVHAHMGARVTRTRMNAGNRIFRQFRHWRFKLAVSRQNADARGAT